MPRKVYRNRLRELRFAKGWESMAEFTRMINQAYDMNISVSTIHLIETHKNENPTWQTIAALADYFDISVDYLMGRSDVSQPADKSSLPMEEQLDPEIKLAMDAFYQKLKSLKEKK